MAFSEAQRRALTRNLSPGKIRIRREGGRDLSYIEGWHAIAEANRIFGFEGWDRETVETRAVLARDTRAQVAVVYLARVRITYAPATASSSVKDTVPARQTRTQRAKLMIWPSRLPRPMPPNGPWPPSGSHSGWRFT